MAKTLRVNQLKSGITVWFVMQSSKGLHTSFIPKALRIKDNCHLRALKSLGEKEHFKSRRFCITKCKEELINYIQ